MAIDESSAFDCVCTDILLKKLQLYNFDPGILKWIHSYMSFRSQFVTIGNQRSAIKPVNQGVPQGSVLRPILFSLYTNEISETVKNNNCAEPIHRTINDSEKLFSENCAKCGHINFYADDTTYVTTGNNIDINKTKITENLETLKQHLNANKLSVNMGKTAILETMVMQKHCKIGGAPPTLQVIDDRGEPKTIVAGKVCRLLGGHFGNDLSWKQQIESGGKALLPSICKKIGALKHISCNIPTKGRKLLAEGIILSKIIYLIPLWGGAPKKYIKKIQVLLNKTARVVTKAGKLTSTKKLMDETGWLYASEMVIYHSLIVTWKIIRLGTLQYFQTKMEIDNDDYITTEESRLKTNAGSFRWRSTRQWNTLPPDVRAAPTVTSFKKLLKQ